MADQQIPRECTTEFGQAPASQRCCRKSFAQEAWIVKKFAAHKCLNDSAANVQRRRLLTLVQVRPRWVTMRLIVTEVAWSESARLCPRSRNRRRRAGSFLRAVTLSRSS
jgi:hypothetical protein